MAALTVLLVTGVGVAPALGAVAPSAITHLTVDLTSSGHFDVEGLGLPALEGGASNGFTNGEVYTNFAINVSVHDGWTGGSPGNGVTLTNVTQTATSLVFDLAGEYPDPYTMSQGDGISVQLGSLSCSGTITNASGANSMSCLQPATALTALPSGGDPGESVTLTATMPGTSGIAPTGSVDFADSGASIGCDVQAVATTDEVTTATCVTSALAVGAHQLTAQYSGDDSYVAGSPATLTFAVSSPTITATVTSAHAKTKYGWYRTPVTITYTCSTGSTGVTTSGCALPVTVTGNGKARTVTRTFTDPQSNVATVTVAVNIDHTKPHLAVHGVKSGRTYRHPRHLTCVASDKLSGIAGHCELTKVKHGKKLVKYTATVTDKAGNTTKVKGRYRVK